MSKREAHLVKEQEAKRKKEAKKNVKSFFLQWAEAIDRFDLERIPITKKEGSEEE